MSEELYEEDLIDQQMQMFLEHMILESPPDKLAEFLVVLQKMLGPDCDVDLLVAAIRAKAKAG